MRLELTKIKIRAFHIFTFSNFHIAYLLIDKNINIKYDNIKEIRIPRHQQAGTR